MAAAAPAPDGTKPPIEAPHVPGDRAATMRARRADPEFVARWSAAMEKVWADPEFRARTSERARAQMRDRWRDPEYRAQRGTRLRQLGTDRKPRDHPLLDRMADWPFPFGGKRSRRARDRRRAQRADE
jgi:hypothetical protein